MKKLAALLLTVILLGTAFPGITEDEPDPLSFFGIRNGRRDEKKIALTVDDCFSLDWTWKIRDMFHDYGIAGTFFPIGTQIRTEDREQWQKILDYGNEIGSHNMGHYAMGSASAASILSSLGRFQQALDAALGYHYQINSFRPPFGNISDENDSTRNFRISVQRFGYEHVVLWDVSQTDPELAFRKLKNGSILLYHARKKDYDCMNVLIPRLLKEGYEFITVSELLSAVMKSAKSLIFFAEKIINKALTLLIRTDKINRTGKGL